MPTWGQLLQELNQLQEDTKGGARGPGDPTPWDILRRKYLKALADLTGRATIVYASAWLEPRSQEPGIITVQLGDIQGFMEAVSNIQERKLDLILHSPGGSAEAAESIVDYLRTRFEHIRVFVPVAAMSAATMMALGADEIVLGAHSQLGPIDPQFAIQTPEGPRTSPSQAILDQFQLAKEECKNPNNLAAWLPILRSYLPGLIAQCEHQRKLAETIVARWLEMYMFNGDPEAKKKAEATSAWFADFKGFLSHSRRVSRIHAREQNLRVVDLEDDHELQDAVLSVHHAVQLSFSQTGMSKIVENHHGRSWLQSVAVQLVGPPVPARPLPAPQQGLSRQQRRHPPG